MLQLLLQAGLEFFNRVVFELKWKPKEDASSSEEESPERPSDEELANLKAIVVDESLQPRDWLKRLFIEHRKSFFKWNGSQKKSELKGACKKKVTEVAPKLGMLLRDQCD